MSVCVFERVPSRSLNARVGGPLAPLPRAELKRPPSANTRITIVIRPSLNLASRPLKILAPKQAYWVQIITKYAVRFRPLGSTSTNSDALCAPDPGHSKFCRVKNKSFCLERKKNPFFKFFLKNPTCFGIFVNSNHYLLPNFKFAVILNWRVCRRKRKTCILGP